MHARHAALIASILIALLMAPASADVTLGPLFSGNAVLQQGIPVPVWGSAADGEKVTVAFQDQSVSSTAQDGKWTVRLKPLNAGGPFKMVVSGNNKVEVNNILVGEVWVCSGQSNMAFTLVKASNGPEAVASSRDPMLRLFIVDRAYSETPASSVKGAWVECGPETAGGFSAVGYFFGRDLRKGRNVPVGLIDSAWGGTPAQAWTPLAAMKSNDVTQAMLAKQPAANQPHKAPGALYNGMIAPLQPYAIRGAIWYQGEANAGDAIGYGTLFPTMIRGWRETWGQGSFPFLFVQLAPFGKVAGKAGGTTWAELRQAQLLTTTTCPKTAMAVITDVGDCENIHPTKKEPVGERLALAARALAYGEKIVYSGPVYDSVKIDGERAIVSFKNVGGGLEARGGELTGWEIAGEDGKFVEARASIQGNTVIVSSPLATSPKAVRYGWSNCPAVNLFNKDGLPASPFGTGSL